MAKKEKKPRADEELHAKDTKPEPEVTEFKTKLNKYGFIHVPKKARPALPFDDEQPLEGRVEDNALILTAKDEA